MLLNPNSKNSKPKSKRSSMSAKLSCREVAWTVQAALLEKHSTISSKNRKKSTEKRVVCKTKCALSNLTWNLFRQKPVNCKK
jgi:hypothetical protein